MIHAEPQRRGAGAFCITGVVFSGEADLAMRQKETRKTEVLGGAVMRNIEKNKKIEFKSF
jgi:hypothetical protein